MGMEYITRGIGGRRRQEEGDLAVGEEHGETYQEVRDHGHGTVERRRVIA